MEKELYERLKANITQYLDIKYIALWNNQLAHINGDTNDGRNQKPFGYPAVFIEFMDSDFRQLSMGVQEFNINLRVHLAYKTLLTEDLDLLDFKQKLYWVCERFQIPNWSRMTRRHEEWDYDHDNVIHLITTYSVYGKDYQRYVLT
jgi:hypothetical protein